MIHLFPPYVRCCSCCYTINRTFFCRPSNQISKIIRQHAGDVFFFFFFLNWKKLNWSYLQSVWFYYFRFHTPSALSHCNDQIDFRFVFDTRHERKPVKHFQQHIWRQQKRQESNGSIKQKTKHHSKIKHKRCPELYDDVLRISTVQ